ncbi:hypothetical protein JMG10_22640 [Nostoc ellipsosporum NOK]|jgi:hypothetical protein|nr:hypothetical protein [Nostoc ellipsosporum NOK]
MDTSTVSLIIAVLALLIAVAAFFVRNNKTTSAPAAPAPAPARDSADGYTSRPLQLQAYERLVVLTERIALPALVNRLNQPGISANDMRIVLVENIRQEYEYNASQQIYVTQQAWEAVRNFKDQNIMLINRVAASVTPEASGVELNKKILETLVAQKLGEVHNLVLEALNHEAKHLMG